MPGWTKVTSSDTRRERVRAGAAQKDLWRRQKKPGFQRKEDLGSIEKVMRLCSRKALSLGANLAGRKAHIVPRSTWNTCPCCRAGEAKSDAETKIARPQMPR